MNFGMDVLKQTSVAISVIDLSAGLCLSVLLSLFGIWVYRWTHRGVHYEKTFETTLVLISPIVSTVMFFIGSNLALSLGMVGALSIIRFRTVVKDSRDMVFLFWMIAIGLGCGTYNWKSSVVASIIIGGLFILIFRFRLEERKKSSYILSIKGSGSGAQQITPLLSKKIDDYKLRSIEHRDAGWELVYEFQNVDSDMNCDSLLSEIKEVGNVGSVSLVSPRLAIPV